MKYFLKPNSQDPQAFGVAQNFANEFYIAGLLMDQDAQGREASGIKTGMGRKKGKEGKEARAEAEVRSQLIQLDLRWDGFYLCICLAAPDNQRDFSTNKSLFGKYLLPRKSLHTAASNGRPMQGSGTRISSSKKQFFIPLVSLSKQSGQHCCPEAEHIPAWCSVLLHYTRTLKSRFHFTAPVHLVSHVFWMLKVSQYFPSLLYNTQQFKELAEMPFSPLHSEHREKYFLTFEILFFKFLSRL